MAPHLSDQTDALRRRARLAAFGCRMAACAVPALLLASWLLGEASEAALARFGMAPDHALTLLQVGAAAAVSLLPALALALSLTGAARCFDGFARGDWFGDRQPRALASAGRWLIASGGLSLVAPTALGLIVTMHAAPGARVFAVALTSNAVLGILFGALLWTLGRLWAVARDIAAENARFV